MHVISQIIDGGAIEADGGTSAPVGTSVATPLYTVCSLPLITVVETYELNFSKWQDDSVSDSCLGIKHS